MIVTSVQCLLTIDAMSLTMIVFFIGNDRLEYETGHFLSFGPAQTFLNHLSIYKQRFIDSPSILQYTR